MKHPNKHAWLEQRIGLKAFLLLRKKRPKFDENNYNKLVSESNFHAHHRELAAVDES